MTIHAAKGLEFPITIVSRHVDRAAGTGRPRPRSSSRRAEASATGSAGTWSPRSSRSGSRSTSRWALDERIRLLYVACTRARDHLVVSLQRKQRTERPDAASSGPTPSCSSTAWATLLDTLPDAVDEETFGVRTVEPPVPPAAPLPFARVGSRARTAVVAQSHPSTVAATALTDEGMADAGAEPDAGLEKRPRDLDLPPWLKGRYGTAVGRAVHGVLQTIDLGTGAGLDDAVAAQCEAEAITDRRAEVRQLAEHALGSAIVREAAALPHWREVYACTPSPVDGCSRATSTCSTAAPTGW